MCTQPPESTIDEHVSIRNKKKNDDDNNREWKKPLASYCRRIILVGTQNVRASWLKVVIDLPPIAASVACIISNYLNCSWIKTRTIPLDRIIRADVLFNGNQRRPQLGKYSTFGLESQLILNKVISWNGNGTIYKKTTSKEEIDQYLISSRVHRKHWCLVVTFVHFHNVWSIVSRDNQIWLSYSLICVRFDKFVSIHCRC